MKYRCTNLREIKFRKQKSMATRNVHGKSYKTQSQLVYIILCKTYELSITFLSHSLPKSKFFHSFFFFFFFFIFFLFNLFNGSLNIRSDKLHKWTQKYSKTRRFHNNGIKKAILNSNIATSMTTVAAKNSPVRWLL